MARNFLSGIKLQGTATAPTSPTVGQLWYDTTAVCLKVYNGTTWDIAGDADLTALTALSSPVSAGFLMKSSTGVWSYNTNTYLTANQSITLSGDVTGTGSTAITTTLASVGTAGTYRSVTTDAKGRVTGGTNPTTIAGYGITDAVSTTGVTMTGGIVTATPSTTVGALRIPHGAPLTTPVNGDIWTTTSGLFARINGVNVGPFGTGTGNGTVTGVTGTAPIVSSGGTAPAISINAASTTASGAVQLSDSTSTTSSTLAATPTAVKAAYDLANGKMTNPLTTTGDIIYSSSGTTAQRLGIGTTGQYITSTGTAPQWSTRYALIERFEYTSGTGTAVTISSSAEWVRVVAQGAGGGAGGAAATAASNFACGSGGGGGGYVEAWYTAASFGTSFDYSVGTGGSGGVAATSTAATAGTASTVTGKTGATSNCTVSGGGGGLGANGGVNSTLSPGASSPGTGGTAATSGTNSPFDSLLINGNGGGRGGAIWGFSAVAVAHGGSSFLSPAPAPILGTGSQAGSTPIGKGGGGSAGQTIQSSSAVVGGAGGNGYITVEVYG